MNKYALLPYGSDDGSIVFRRSLKVQPTANIAGGDDVGNCSSVTVTGGGHAFLDPEGFQANGSNILFAGVPGWHLLDDAGQVYFEVDRNVLAIANSGSEGSSGGYVFSDAQVIVSSYPDGSPDGNEINLFNAANAAATRAIGLLAGWGAAAGSRSGGFNDALSGQFVPVVIWMNGKDIGIHVDGELFGVITRANITSVLSGLTPSAYWKNILIGRHPLASGAGFNMTVGSVRNFQISNRAPSLLASSDALRKVAVYGDSYADSPPVYQTSTWNLAKSLRCEAALNAGGYGLGDWDATGSHGGAVVQGSNPTVGGPAGNNLANTTYRASLRASNPSAVVIQCGANDLTQLGAIAGGNYAAYYRDAIEFIMGVGRYGPRSAVRGIVACTTPYTPDYPAPPVEFIEGISGTNSAAYVLAQPGDLVVVFAFKESAGSPPTLGSGFTSLQTRGGTSCSALMGYRIVQSGDTGTGAWAGATSLVAHVHRGALAASPVGQFISFAGVGTSVDYKGMVPSASDASSRFALFAGHRSIDTALQTPPAGTVLRTTVVDATDEAAGFDTGVGVTGFEEATVEVGGSSSGWVTMGVEIRADVDAGVAAQRKPDITTVRNAVLALPAWWNATYPQLAGRVVVRDIWQDFGGFSVPGNLFGATDALHPSNIGAARMGQSWAAGLLELVRTLRQ